MESFREIIHNVRWNDTEELPDAVQFASSIELHACNRRADETTQIVQDRLPVPDRSSFRNRRRMRSPLTISIRSWRKLRFQNKRIKCVVKSLRQVREKFNETFSTFFLVLIWINLKNYQKNTDSKIQKYIM